MALNSIGDNIVNRLLCRQAHWICKLNWIKQLGLTGNWTFDVFYESCLLIICSCCSHEYSLVFLCQLNESWNNIGLLYSPPTLLSLWDDCCWGEGNYLKHSLSVPLLFEPDYRDACFIKTLALKRSNVTCMLQCLLGTKSLPCYSETPCYCVTQPCVCAPL